jgi:hypothetical protein
MKEELEKIKAHIKKGNLEKAMELLKTATRHIPDFEQQILLLEARLSRYNRALTGGVIDVLNQEFNAITNGLLSLVKEAGAEENQSEDAILKNVRDTLRLNPIQGEKSVLYFKRFRTDEVFDMLVSLDMNTRELKNDLIPAAMPKYLRSPEMQEIFGFELMLLRTGAVLNDARSLRKNGVQSGDTVYLRKYFFGPEAEEEADGLNAAVEGPVEEKLDYEGPTMDDIGEMSFDKGI